MKKWEGYYQGVNLGGWLSQCVHTKEHYDSFIHEEDIKKIATWGVDHIRVPVDYNLVETKEGSYIEEGFGYIENCIAWCRKYQLNMILDLHKTFGYSFDDGEKEAGFFENEKYQDRFVSLWKQFATRFAGNDDMLAFELLNEVTDQSYCATWNAIAEKCICAIRQIHPTVKILVGGYWNNHAHAVKDLDKPHDENVIYNFHCYEPILFTHQGAHWVKGMPHDFRCGFTCTEGDLKEKTDEIFGSYFNDAFAEGFEKQPLGKDFFIRFFKPAVEAAEKYDVPLYCGEYGVIELADATECQKWHQDIHEAFAYYGIGHAVWSYKKMDFGIEDRNLQGIFKK